MTFESKIWSIETISAKPIYALTQWQAFECRVGRSKGRSRHLVGAPGPDINPVISGTIARLDPGSSCGATESAKVYPAYVDIEAARRALPELYASVYPPGFLDDPLQPYAEDKNDRT